jgi:hypothetical protein
MIGNKIPRPFAIIGANLELRRLIDDVCKLEMMWVEE